MLNNGKLFLLTQIFVIKPLFSIFAQGVAISENMQEPHTSSILDVISFDNGVYGQKLNIIP